MSYPNRLIFIYSKLSPKPQPISKILGFFFTLEIKIFSYFVTFHYFLKNRVNKWRRQYAIKLLVFDSLNKVLL